MVDGHADHARGAGRRERLASLLDLAAADEAAGFRAALDAAGSEAAELVDEVELWYGRSKAYEPRTPLMVAATCGSAAVVALLLGLGCVDVNRRPGVDGATALHCAASGGSPNAVAVVRLLLAAGADPAIPDSAGRVPADVVHAHPASPDTLAGLEALLGRRRELSPVSALVYTTTANGGGNKKAYPVDPTLPDMSSSVYASDEFRMFAFKVQPCARAYAHEWTECPFVHPGENARRRDPRRHAYTAVPCDSFRLADGCPRGDACDFAHGVFESWLHPSRYRTRLCRDGAACSRRICFFAHAEHELRYVSRDGASTALLSPRTMDDMAAAATLGLQFPRSPTGGHFLQQGSKRYAAFDACLEEQVDELSALFDFASLSRSQPLLESIRRPSAAPPLTYMALPPSRFGNDHGASVYSPQPAQTSQLLARIRQQQGVRLPPVKQREMFERPFSCPTLKHHHLRSPPVTARGYSDASWINAGCPGSKVDWSFNAEELLRSP